MSPIVQFYSLEEGNLSTAWYAFILGGHLLTNNLLCGATPPVVRPRRRALAGNRGRFEDGVRPERIRGGSGGRGHRKGVSLQLSTAPPVCRCMVEPLLAFNAKPQTQVTLDKSATSA